MAFDTRSIYERFGKVKTSTASQRQYVVNGGESLQAIVAKVYQSGYSSEAIRQLAEFNNLDDFDAITANQVLIIPELTPTDPVTLDEVTKIDVGGLLPQPPSGFLGQGISYPCDAENGRLTLSTNEDLVAQSVQSIVLTAQGERAMMPYYGAGVRIGQQLDDLTKEKIVDKIIQNEPRIDQDSLSVDLPIKDFNGEVDSTIKYKIAGQTTERVLTGDQFGL